MKIGFSTDDGFFSRMIRKFTGSEWSHCFIVLDDKFHGIDLVFESTAKGGVRLSLLSEKDNDRVELYEIPGTPSIEPVLKYYGRKYGYLQIFGFVIAKALFLKNNPITKDYVCSEIALRFMLENGYQEFSNIKPNNATPEDMHSVVKSNGYKRLI